MKKEMVVFLAFSLVAIGALVSQIDFGDKTGAVINELARVRLSRLELARVNFHAIGSSAECKAELKQVMDLLRTGGDERYYSPQGLTDFERYFMAEEQLINKLLRLSGLGKIERESQFPQDTNEMDCPPEIATQAQEKLAKLVDHDLRLTYMTIENAACNDTRPAVAAYDKAVVFYRESNYAAFFDSMEAAVEATKC